ncbi:MAG: alpha/beta hydrolase family protein [Stackebrandtia sp.]
MSQANLGWVALLPGQDGLIRVHLPADAKQATFDLPARMQFGRELHAVRPFDPEAWRARVGEYSDGDIRIVLTMNSDPNLGEPYPFYVDLDHDAVVPLTPIAEDRLLSEQGEELTFTAEGDLRIAIEGAEAILHRAKEPVEEDVSFLVSGEATVLSGTLLRPAGGAAVPGVVVAHGSGFHQRDFYRMYAHAVARAGMAALIFDRQGHGSSTGEQTGGLQDNAAGIEAAIDFLRGREDVSDVGLWGISNGMWTVPLVTARRPDVAFIAGVSAPGVTAAESEVHRRTNALRQGGVADEAVELAGKIWRILFEIDVNGKSTAAQVKKLEPLLKKLRANKSVKDFTVPDYAVATPALSPLPPKGSAAQLAEEFAGDPDPSFGYDPVNGYREISCPVLLQYGTDDVNVPAAESQKRIRDALTEGGNEDFTITAYSGAGHMLERVPADVEGMTYEQASYRLHGFRFASGAINELITWLKARAQS